MSIPANLQRKPFFAPIGLAALTAMTAMVAALVLIVLAWLLITAKSTTIIVVRHAETVLEGGADPPLTSEGQARADDLARMFGDPHLKDHIDAIYVSPTVRNQLTAAPLAQRLGLTPTVVTQDDARAFARRVLREHRGGRVLVIAHSYNIPAIVTALSGVEGIPPILKLEYGTMYIVTVPRIGRAGLLSVDY